MRPPADMPSAPKPSRPPVGAFAYAHDQGFERIVLALHDATLHDTAWSRAGALIDDACSMHSNHLFVVDNRDGEKRHYLFGSWRAHGASLEALEREYAEAFFPTDERIPRLLRMPAGSLIHNGDLYTESEQRASLTYNDFLPRCGASQGGADQICVRLEGLDGLHVFWAATRLATQGAWRRAHMDVLRRLLPHIQGFVRTRQALAKADALAAALPVAMNAPAKGVLLLDRAGRVVRANDRARELLADDRPLSVRDDILHAARAEDAKGLARLLGLALPARGRQPARGAMAFGQSTAVVNVGIDPVGIERQDFGARRVAAAMVITAESEARA